MVALRYGDYLADDCIDLVQLRDICSLYKNKSGSVESISLSEIEFSTPDFKKPKLTKNSLNKDKEILKTTEFKKKYLFFIKIIYTCLKLGVEIFEVNETKSPKSNKASGANGANGVNGANGPKGMGIPIASEPFPTLKSNYKLLKSVLDAKKNLIQDHINILKDHQKNLHQFVDSSYDEYSSEYVCKIKILDKIAKFIDSLIKNSVLDNTDNLFALILPYFYVYQDYIEEYNG